MDRDLEARQAVDSRPKKKLKRLSDGSPTIRSDDCVTTPSPQDQTKVSGTDMKNYQNLATEVKKLREEVEDLKHKSAKTSEEEAHYSSFISEEDNKILRKEVEELVKNISIVGEDLSREKKISETMKQKLEKEIDSLENEYKDLESEILKNKNNENVIKLQNERKKIAQESTNTYMSNFRLGYRVDALKSKLQRYEELQKKKAEPPKEEPLSKDHLSMHNSYKLNIRTTKKLIKYEHVRLDLLRKQIQMYRKLRDEGKKEKYVNEAISEALVEKFSEARKLALPPVQRDEYMQELDEFKEGIRKKAEKKYEETEQLEQPGCSKEPDLFSGFF